MKYLVVTNWDEYQGYKKGTRPDWIRIYPALLNPAKHVNFSRLSDGAKLTLHHLRLLAAECDNIIPETWVTRERLNMQTRPKVDEVVASGFAEWRLSLATANCQTNSKDTLSLVSSASGLFNQETAFGEIWADILAARVPDPKHKALARRYFFGSVGSAELLSSLRKAIANYRESDRVAKGFVQDASTFMHDWQQWVDRNPVTKRAADGFTITQQVGVTADEIRDLEFELRHEWMRQDCTKGEVESYVSHIRSTYADRLNEAPTLAEWLIAMRGAA